MSKYVFAYHGGGMAETPEEQAAGDQFTPCCSRAKTSQLLLDL